MLTTLWYREGGEFIDAPWSPFVFVPSTDPEMESKLEVEAGPLSLTIELRNGAPDAAGKPFTGFLSQSLTLDGLPWVVKGNEAAHFESVSEDEREVSIVMNERNPFHYLSFLLFVSAPDATFAPDICGGRFFVRQEARVERRHVHLLGAHLDEFDGYFWLEQQEVGDNANHPIVRWSLTGNEAVFDLEPMRVIRAREVPGES